MKRLTSVLVGLLLLTGCSSEVKKELKYDELDLIRYKACVEYATDGWARKSWTYSELVTDQAIESCAKYLPVKK
jgi:hypothetical protein